MRGYARVAAGTKAPQAEGISQRDVTRAWTRVVGLMFAPRSHATGDGGVSTTQVAGSNCRPAT